MTDLIPGHQADAFGINNLGQVVGASDRFPGGAFLWEDGRVTSLGTVTGAETSARGINALGHVVGTEWGNGDTRQGFRWINGVMTNLGPTLSQANDINDWGQIVGEGGLWDNGEVTDLGTLGDGGVIADAINNHGQVVGAGGTAPNGPQHAFLWHDGVINDLNDLIPQDSGWELMRGTDINDRGQVTGVGRIDGQVRGFLWEDGSITDLGALVDGGSSAAWGINNLGQIVGWGSSLPGSGYGYGFIWQDGVMTDLGTLGSGEYIDVFARDINDRGQVVGRSYTDDDLPEGIPEPSTALLLSPGLIGLLILGRKFKR